MISNEILAKWIKYFEDLPIGKHVSTDRVNREEFIEMCKDFIDAGNYDFSFTSDYKYFKRDKPLEFL